MEAGTLPKNPTILIAVIITYITNITINSTTIIMYVSKEREIF